MAENEPAKTCPKCGRQMEEGYIPDRGYGVVQVAIWISGQPRKAFLGGIDIDGKSMVAIQTFRCLECGYLESYAK
jgi:predicted nucleic-acid-binding Zn-ribbon protein